MFRSLSNHASVTALALSGTFWLYLVFSGWCQLVPVLLRVLCKRSVLRLRGNPALLVRQPVPPTLEKIMNKYAGLTVSQARHIRSINRIFVANIDKTPFASIILAYNVLAEGGIAATLDAQQKAGWPIPVLRALSRCLLSI